jgi:hypothetical protein
MAPSVRDLFVVVVGRQRSKDEARFELKLEEWKSNEVRKAGRLGCQGNDFFVFVSSTQKEVERKTIPTSDACAVITISAIASRR